MRNLLIAIALLVFSATAISDVRPEFSGAWYNPNQSGHGFSVDVISEERTIAFWYAYDLAGAPIFLLLDGVNRGNRVEATAYSFEGMVWGEFDPATNESTTWGTVTLEFTSCASANLSWNSSVPGYGSGSMELVHLASLEGFRCSDERLAGLYIGTMISDTYDVVSWGVGMVDHNGVMNYLNDAGELLTGVLPPQTGKLGTITFSGLASVIEPPVYYTGIFEASGDYSPDGFTVDYEFQTPAYDDAGQLIMSRLAYSSTRPFVPGEMAGQWNMESIWLDQPIPIQIDSDGRFSFNHSSECVIDAGFRTFQSDMNVAFLSFAPRAGCPSTDQQHYSAGHDGGEVVALGFAEGAPEEAPAPQVFIFNRR